jgi:phage/plasmid-like protein (TIGR03299 family)
MSHEIDSTTGRPAIMTLGASWHGLGTVVERAQTSREALQHAGLDWKVERRALVTVDGAAVPRRVATVRQDTGAVLGVVGSQYHPLQNQEALEWMDAIAGEGLAHWHTAGSLHGGREVFMLAKLPKTIEVSNQDVLEQYVLIVNGHAGTRCLTLFPTSVRVVCWNTLRLAESQRGTTVRLTHRAGTLARRVDAAKAALGIIAKQHDEFNDQVAAMVRQTLTVQQVDDYFLDCVPAGSSQRQTAKLLSAFGSNLHNERNAGLRGDYNAWTALNSVTEYADWGMRSRGVDATAKSDNRTASVLFGSASRLKESAFSRALALCS